MKNAQKFPWEKTFEELGILNGLMTHCSSSNEIISDLPITSYLLFNSGEAKCNKETVIKNAHR